MTFLLCYSQILNPLFLIFLSHLWTPLYVICFIYDAFLCRFRPSRVLFSLLKVTEVVMIYDAEKQRPRGNPHIHICSHSVSLSLTSCARQTIPTQREENITQVIHPSHVCDVWFGVSQLLHGGKANQQHPHDPQTFASNMLSQFGVLHICLCLKGAVHRKMKIDFFFYSIQICMLLFFLWNTKGEIMEVTLLLFFS